LIRTTILATLLAALSAVAEAQVSTIVEEARLPLVRERHPEIDVEGLAAPVLAMLPGRDPADLGGLLWRSATARVQAGLRDDRPLYWARLAVQASLGGRGRRAETSAFRWSSRGLDQVLYPDPGELRVLITGFDPFHLDARTDQSNPSGLAALALDGSVLDTRRGPARVEAVVMPVRFADFDDGLIERFLAPLLAGARLDLVVTISMGRDRFDLERFPGRRRSAAVPDNADVRTGASVDRPLVPRLDGRPLDGPEFLEFTLPAAAMAAVEGPYAVRDNRLVRTREHGERVIRRLEALAGDTAVAGSGGGYLSNEIAYRTLLLNRRLGANVPMGHVHTPRLEGFDAGMEWAVVTQIRALIVAAIESLPPRQES
jgi:pyrrolidone-carboxylate peptidase